jgi:hypothetical protein
MPAIKVLNCQQKAQKPSSAPDFIIADLDLIAGKVAGYVSDLAER